MTDTTSKTVFEHVTCSRCCGTGSYSYCSMYGSRCFKCHGAGWVHTKRGLVASKFYVDSLCVPVRELSVGSVVRVESYGINVRYTLWGTVTAFELNTDADSVKFSVEYRKPLNKDETGQRAHVSGGSLVRVERSAEFKRDALARALAYQETLTKTGAPKKRKAA